MFSSHVTGYQPIRDQNFLIWSILGSWHLPYHSCVSWGRQHWLSYQWGSVPDQGCELTCLHRAHLPSNTQLPAGNMARYQQPTGPSKQPIRAHNLGQVTGFSQLGTSMSWAGRFLVKLSSHVTSIQEVTCEYVTL